MFDLYMKIVSSVFIGSTPLAGVFTFIYIFTYSEVFNTLATMSLTIALVSMILFMAGVIHDVWRG